MSFLARLAQRATTPGSAAVLVPKQRRARSPAVRRAEVGPEPEPEEIAEAPVREARRRPASGLLRAAEEPAEEEAQLAREIEETDEGEAQRASAGAPAAEPPADEAPEEMQPARLARQAEEPELERETAPEEGPEEMRASPVARSVVAYRAGGVLEEDEEEIQAARSLTTEDMLPENATPAEETAGEPEPPDLRALRRSPDAPAAPATGAPAGWGPGADAVVSEVGDAAASAATPPPGTAAVLVPSSFEAPDFAPDAMLAGPAGATSSASRPRILIEQLDVVIHEPAPVATPSRDSGALSRGAVRARYLRRL